MNRELVVPWSTAPTKSGMHSSLSSRWGGSRSLDFLLRGGASQGDRRQAPHPALRLRASPGFLREPGLLDRTANVLDHLEPGVQHVSDEEVVDDHAKYASDEGADDGHPEVDAEVEGSRAEGPRQGHLSPPCEVGEEPGPEIAGRVDGVPRVRAIGHPDRGHGEADD